MAMMDNMDDQMQDIMDDPDTRMEIEQMANDEGISIEDAKRKYMQQHM